MAPQAKSIVSLLNDIQRGEIALPDLQRDFVWGDDQIRTLFDSIMRDYPFGTLLLWNTQFLEVVYREFVRDYKKKQTSATKIKAQGHRMMMVLDGQQRLQSLYVALYGTYDGRQLWFNMASGRPLPSDDDDDGTSAKYKFEFWGNDDTNRPKRLIRVADVMRWPARMERQSIEKAVTAAGLDATEAELARDNLHRLSRVLQENTVPVVTVDDDITTAEQARSIKEILEIFVRVNSGGTRLSQSDLMFSLIKTKWVGARERFDSLLAEIVGAGFVQIDKDFLIRGLLTVADAPTKFDVEVIERHWDEMEPKFSVFAESIKSALDFCRSSNVRILSASLLTPMATLFPIVYYLSRQKNGSVPKGQHQALRSLLYFLLFNEFLGGKSPEARIRYMREVLQRNPGIQVPLDAMLAEVARRQRHHAIVTDSEMLQWNPKLTLNIVQPTAAKATLSWQEKAEVDHIFPQSTYRPKYGELVDDIGNFAYLGKLRNSRKSNEEPSEYFKGVSEDDLREEFIIDDRTLLAPDKFAEFVERRRAAIVSKAKVFLGR